MGGCPNYGPLVGFFSRIRQLVFRDPEGDHNFDNHPHGMDTQSFQQSLVENYAVNHIGILRGQTAACTPILVLMQAIYLK